MIGAGEHGLLCNGEHFSKKKYDDLIKFLDELVCNPIRNQLIEVINNFIDNDNFLKTEIIKKLNTIKTCNLTMNNTWDEIMIFIKEL